MAKIVEFRREPCRRGTRCHPVDLAIEGSVWEDTRLRNLIDDWIVPKLVDDWMSQIEDPDPCASKDNGERHD